MPRATYSNVSEHEAEAACPGEPPCFQSKRQFREYLWDCQQTIRRPPNRPYTAIVEDGKRVVKYRPDFSFCRDCPDEHANKMRASRLCQPDHFKVVEPCN